MNGEHKKPVESLSEDEDVDPCPMGGEHEWRDSKMYTDEVHYVPSSTCTRCHEERI